MDAYDIKTMIEEDVRVDIYGDFYGHDKVAETIAAYIDMLKERIKEIELKNSWNGSVDRQGGSFTDQEIIDDNTWR